MTAKTKDVEAIEKLESGEEEIQTRPIKKSPETAPKKIDLSYEDLLKRAREGVPKEAFEVSRFEMPRFDSFMQGPQTIIKNFMEIAKTLHREPQHLLKYISIEAGTFGDIDGPRLILKGRKTTDFLNTKLESYVNEFVLCEQCKKPDTEIRKEEGIMRIKCKACSAKYTIRTI